ncbi:hypothetical protein GOQ29_05780 [Clostridium sp. D2Q-14]|uniref:hypothetical protein n=1 Tax=Anaeromonas gelatinilytica TaxID=2683194 RepID=UPI00193C6804|nr:hypothetical protein [Anaeromonas gelatinilytica]MBS4535128.1 hypothetical protein [Anaeromonas gelatinilytica]
MEALIWKRLKEIKGSKTKTITYYLLPFIYGGILLIMNVPQDIIVGYYCFGIILMTSLFHWNVEDIIYSEVLLSTNISPFKFWITNSLLISIIGFIYSMIILLVFSFIYYIFSGNIFGGCIIPFIQGFVNFFMGLAMISIATLHYVDFSKIKQYLTSILGIINFIFPFIHIFFYKYLEVSYKMIGMYLLSGIIMMIIVIFIAIKSKKENLIRNTKKLVNMYQSQELDD